MHETPAELAVRAHRQVLAALADCQPAIAHLIAGKIAAQCICGSIQQGIFLALCAIGTPGIGLSFKKSGKETQHTMSQPDGG